MAVEAFPLFWPQDWKRTPAALRTRATFRTTFDNARRQLLDEVKRLGGRDPILSTNVPLRLDGQPRSDWARTRIDDPGVAVYFGLRGKQHVIACDRYGAIYENLRAVGLSITCLRGLKRYGASTVLERAFTGFVALPAPGASSPSAKQSCWEVLGIGRPTDNRDAVEMAYRERARQVHPDVGGTAAQMAELNAAREEALDGIAALRGARA